MPDAAKLAALGKVLAKARPKKAHNTRTSYGPTVTSIEQEYAWHPLTGWVQREVSLLSVAKRSDLLVGWFGWLATRQKAAGTALQAAGIAADLPQHLLEEKDLRRKLPTGPGPGKPHFVDPRLRLVAGRANTLGTEPDGTDQALAGLADPTGTAAAAAGSPAVTTELLQQIRNLAEVYARWEAAATIATKLVGHQLARPALSAPELVARLLAVFRTEGDLNVLPESDTLDASLQAVPLPPGRSDMTAALYPSYYTYCATYLTDPAKYARFVAKNKLASDPVIDADSGFALTMAGMDIMWNRKFQPEVEACYPTTPPYDSIVNPQKDVFDWMALNREQASQQLHSAAVDEVTYELVARRQMLDFTTITTDIAGTANRITAIGRQAYGNITLDPGSPAGWALAASGAAVGYLLLLLNQPAWYLDRLTYGPTRFGPAAPTRLPESIVYLLYHVGSEAPAMLSSAALAAADPQAGSASAQALRTVLRQHGYTRAVAKAATSVISAHKVSKSRFESLSQDQLDTLHDNWPTVAPVLGHSEVLPVLADYIVNADGHEWKSWTGARANILGYRRMYEYLQQQVAP